MGRYCKKSGRGSVGPSDTVVLHLPLAEAQPEPEMQLWGELQTRCESLGGEVRAIRSAAELGWAEPLGEAELGGGGKAQGRGDDGLLCRERQQPPQLEGLLLVSSF